MNYTTQLVDNILVVELAGDLISVNDAQNLLQEVDEAISEEVRFCVVDMVKVRYINSSGIGVITTLLTRFRTRGGELVLTRPSEQLYRLLIITKLTAIFTIADNQKEAILKLKHA